MMGLYSVLWGKYKESQENEASPIPVATKIVESNSNGNGDVELKKAITIVGDMDVISTLSAHANDIPMKGREGTGM